MKENIFLTQEIGSIRKPNWALKALRDKNSNIKSLMRKLAQEQKLYLIIASTDYIYGTNYQFCHGYLSKDLENMTQEKMLQAFGRVGRSSSQSDYTLRIRDDELIIKLYTKDDNTVVVPKSQIQTFNIPLKVKEVDEDNQTLYVAENKADYDHNNQVDFEDSP